jgi:DNA-binding SARP family transcriptional activator
VEFLVLGPMAAVSDAGMPLELGPPKARAALAVLLCRAGRVVGMDSLVDALWPEAPPAHAVKNVQLYMHQLRRGLGEEGRIRHRAGGYLLAAEPGEIDAHRFAALACQHEGAAARGDLAGARGLLTQALGLWQGDQAYAGISAVPPVTAEAQRLAEARLAAVRSRIDLDLRLGRHLEVVADLAALTREYPLHERFWAQLITALYRCGRPAEALAAYDSARRVIVGETGLDPGDELRDLQQAILTGRPPDHLPAPGPAPSVPGLAQPAGPAAGPAAGDGVPDAPPRMLPPDASDFTGRRAELAAISAALAAPHQPDGAAEPSGPPHAGHAAGAVPVAVLTGQGGVGKTALAVHAAHRLAGTYPDGQLFAMLAGAQPSPADPDEVLATLLRALGVPGAAVPAAGEERAALYRSLLAGKRILVVLDGAASEAQVRPLLPGTSSCAVVITSRARLGGLPGARQTDLAPLPAADGRRLLARIAGQARTSSDPAAAAELVGLCAGLPLALRIAGSRLASRPHWSVAELAGRLADEHRRLDTLRHGDLEVRASFALSYGGLGPDERRLFRLLGLLEAPDVARWSAAALLDTTAEDAEDLIETLADARLLDVSGPDEAGQRRYRFHDLVRLYARELAEAEETARARAAALSRVFAMLLSLTDAVRQAADGGDYALIKGEAPRWRPREVASALPAMGRPMDALRAERLSLVAATYQAAALGMDETCWQLCVGAYMGYQAGAYFDDWHDTHHRALAAVEAAGNRYGTAVMLLMLAGCYHAQRRLALAKDCADRALALFGQIGDRCGYALMLRRSSQYERHAGHFGEAITRAQKAHELLTALGDPAAAADSLAYEGIAHFEGGDPAAAVAVLIQAVAAASRFGNRQTVAHGCYWLALAQLTLGRSGEAAAAVAELSEFVRTAGDEIGAVYACHARGRLARAMGDAAVTRREFEAGLAAAREIHDPLMQVRFLTDLGELCLAGGQQHAAAGLLAEAVTTGECLDFPLSRARPLRLLGDARAATGDLDGARAAWHEADAIFAAIEPAEAVKPGCAR